MNHLNSTSACKVYLSHEFPSTAARDWSRRSKYRDGETIGRTFLHNRTGQTALVLWHPTNGLSVPPVQQVAREDTEAICAIIDNFEEERLESPEMFEDLTGKMAYYPPTDPEEGFHFALGPQCLVNGGQLALHDTLGCYEWMAQTLGPWFTERGYNLSTGEAENMHAVYQNGGLAVDIDDVDTVIQLETAFCLFLRSVMPPGVELWAEPREY